MICNKYNEHNIIQYIKISDMIQGVHKIPHQLKKRRRRTSGYKRRKSQCRQLIEIKRTRYLKCIVD